MWPPQAADMPGLAPEVRQYEAHAALCGGTDGADVIRDLLRVAPRLLCAAGPRAIWLEVAAVNQSVSQPASQSVSKRVSK